MSTKITYIGKSKVIIRLCEAVNDLIDNSGKVNDTNTTYTISISGHTLTLTGSDGTSLPVNLPDENTVYDDSEIRNAINAINELLGGHSVGTDIPASALFTDTKYGLSITGNTVSLVEGGTSSSVTIPDTNTTYSLSINGSTLTLTASDNTHSDVTIPAASYDDSEIRKDIEELQNNLNGHIIKSDVPADAVFTDTDTNTTYTFTLNGSTLKITDSDGGVQSVPLPSGGSGTSSGAAVTYAISLKDGVITLTGSDGSSQDVTLPTDQNTTYTFGDDKAIDSTGASQDVTVTKVNGHTVEADVPEGAVFTDTLYDDGPLAERVSTLEENMGDIKTVLAKVVTA